MILRPGNLSSVPSKIRCDSAIVVSSGLPIVLPSQPLPDRRLFSSTTPCGWMNSGTPSSSALAHTGWNFGSENSRPFTAPPTAAPLRPCFFTAVSSSCTARSGACRVSEAKAANRSGLLAHNSASFSFWILTILAARSRSRPYQKGLIDSTSMSTACESIAARRLSTSMKASCAPFTTDGAWIAWASAPSSAPASWNWQCEWTSIVFTRLPETITGSLRGVPCARAWSSRPQLQNTTPVARPPLRKLRRVLMSAPPICRYGGAACRAAVARSRACGRLHDSSTDAKPTQTRTRGSGRQGRLASRVAGDAAVPHDAPLGHVPGRRLVQQAAIVPQHRIPRPPVVVPGARPLAGEGDEVLEEALRFGIVHSGNVVRVTADQQRLAAGLGMDLHQLPQRHRPVMEAVAAVLAVGLLLAGVVPELALAVVQRVIGSEALDLGLGRGVERVIGRAHVGEAGVAADRRHFLGTEHRALGLDRHVGRIAMPAHVALEDLHAVVVVLLEPQGAVLLDVADRCHLELERPETLGEGDLLGARQMLPGEDQQRVFQPGVIERPECPFVDLRDAEAGDDGAERSVDRFDLERGCHEILPMMHGKS